MAQLAILASQHHVVHSPLIAAVAGGFLEREGMQANYRQLRPGECVEKHLSSGRVQIAQSNVFACMRNGQTNELPTIRYFAHVSIRDGYFLNAREPNPEFSWHSLVGKKVLVDGASQPLAMFRHACLQQGVDDTSIEMIVAGGEDEMLRSFSSGKAAYLHLQGPAAQELCAGGTAHLVARVGDAMGPVASSSLCASPSWLHSTEASAFMRAYRAARAWVHSAPATDVTRCVAGCFPATETQALAQAIAAYQALGCWDGDEAIAQPEFERTVEVLAHAGIVPTAVGYDRICARPPG